MTAMHIRDAVPEDAAAACGVLRRSITELCAADHHNDPELLAGWLANKTVANVLSWIRPGNSLLVAEEADAILAVGSVTDAGMITLNYVSPMARFRGVSRALIQALEDRARECGNATCRLTSTATAHRFYRANGYEDDGPPVALGRMTGYPMAKSLTARRTPNCHGRA